MQIFKYQWFWKTLVHIFDHFLTDPLFPSIFLSKRCNLKGFFHHFLLHPPFSLLSLCLRKNSSFLFSYSWSVCQFLLMSKIDLFIPVPASPPPPFLLSLTSLFHSPSVFHRCQKDVCVLWMWSGGDVWMFWSRTVCLTVWIQRPIDC